MKAQVGTHAPTGKYLGWVVVNGKAVAAALYPRRNRNDAAVDSLELLRAVQASL
jgi:hypothetical protein